MLKGFDAFAMSHQPCDMTHLSHEEKLLTKMFEHGLTAAQMLILLKADCYPTEGVSAPQLRDEFGLTFSRAVIHHSFKMLEKKGFAKRLLRAGSQPKIRMTAKAAKLLQSLSL